MLRSFSRSEVGGRARGLLALLIGLLLAINTLNVLNSYVGRDFMTALEQRRVPDFIRESILYLAVFACSTVAEAFLRFTEESFAITWREWMARWTVRHYLRPPVYHRLSDRLIAEGEVPNPDERIADDVRAFTSTTVSFLLLSLNGSITMLAFSGVLWSISPLLFVVGILYAAAGSLLAYAWGRPLVKLNEIQLDREANFRAELMHVRENAESLAVARREDALLRRLLARIEGWASNFRRIVRVNRSVGLTVTGYRYLLQILPVLIVAPLYIAGDVEFGVVTQSAMAFAQLVGAFSLVVTQFQPLTSYAAVISRLGVLDEGIERARARPVLATEVCPHHSRTSTCPLCVDRPLTSSSISTGLSPDGKVVFDRLTLLSMSDCRVLTRELKGSVGPGVRLLVTGANDEAKTALFRATAGTWTLGSGRVLRPADGGMAFLAERPYLPPGTLRQALTGQAPPTDDAIRSVLDEVGLHGVLSRVGGLDVERRWDAVLSLGEQQLLAAAYVLLSHPQAVFLERPGTALDPDALSRVLRAFAETGAALLVIARREDAPDYFTGELSLSNDGSWELR